MAGKPTPRQHADFIRKQTKEQLRFISGKWFYKDEEVQNIRRFLLHIDAQIDTPNMCDEVLDMYIMLYGEDGNWLDTDILKEAKQVKTLKPLCFPLNKKQLTIINRLLVGLDDEVCFITTGVGGSGKSTFLNIVKQLFNNDVSSCPLAELTGYQTAEAVKHRLIASDELNSDELDNGTLKTIISRQTIQVNPKFEKPYQVKCQSALFYCCNIAPRIDLDDTGLLRRIIFYKMNDKIKAPDTTLNHREWTHDDLVNIAAHALAVNVTDWRKDFEAETHEYLLKNNSVYIFRKIKDYAEYVSECNHAKLKPYSQPKWENIRALINEWNMDPPIFKVLTEVAPEDRPF